MQTRKSYLVGRGLFIEESWKKEESDKSAY